MPLRKPQELKSLSTINLQPQNETPKMRVILYMDLAGRGTGEIAESLGMTAGRISIIKTSPMYARMKETEEQTLKDKFMDKQTDALTIDPVKKTFKDAALDIAQGMLGIARTGQSEFAKLQASKDVLDRAGYAVEKSKISVPSITVEAKVITQFQEMYKHACDRPSTTS